MQLRAVLISTLLLGACGQASECSHTTCEFKTISLPASIAAQIPGTTGVTQIMVIHHSNDETRCHAYDNTQNADGTWSRHNGCNASKTACYAGLHCGLSDKSNTTTCKCYREGITALSKTGDMQHNVASHFAQTTNDVNPDRNRAHDMSTINASAAKQHPSNIVDAPHASIPHFNGPDGSHAGGDNEHNPPATLCPPNNWGSPATQCTPCGPGQGVIYAGCSITPSMPDPYSGCRTCGQKVTYPCIDGAGNQYCQPKHIVPTTGPNGHRLHVRGPNQGCTRGLCHVCGYEGGDYCNGSEQGTDGPCDEGLAPMKYGNHLCRDPSVYVPLPNVGGVYYHPVGSSNTPDMSRPLLG